jgi:lysophospholipase L1-like esterase
MKHSPLLILSLALNLLLAAALFYIAHKMGYLGRFLVATTSQNLAAPTDILMTQPVWQEAVQYQQTVAGNQHFKVCLFGDSISAGVENTLGDGTFNFAISGMSTISQLEQLKALAAVQVNCEVAIVAIGTNDAAYRTTETQFEQNLYEMIALLKHQMATQKILLLPAFYSTVAASHDPAIAGTVERVNLINTRIDQVGKAENLPVVAEVSQPLFAGQALRDDLTIDGVHLNLKGKQLYRSRLLQLIRSNSPRTR